MSVKLEQVYDVKNFATQYRVILDGVNIGLVSRIFQDWRSRRPATWQFENSLGSTGQHLSRTKAINSLLFIHNQNRGK